ncbi:hypothetical protein NHX12_024756 [Muraenolepis orangiensis]|uniref:Reverse transcriptase domain-containing protein n=1 Tax=Muraenolepis orangiensis TaxID=630683 RepID=A0A9Q0IRM0_9TELE|nr:hypothetical protein NHX12_024756 [Muraenolepis orangiensis]
MQRNSLFTDKQYGFISGRSTTLQLITVLDEWTSIIDDWGCIDAIYSDFQKAFDKVPHKCLTHKLEEYGVKDVVDENSRVYLFADDTKLYRRIDSKDGCDKLQKDLSALQSWSKDWLLKFQPDNFSEELVKRVKAEGKAVERETMDLPDMVTDLSVPPGTTEGPKTQTKGNPRGESYPTIQGPDVSAVPPQHLRTPPWAKFYGPGGPGERVSSLSSDQLHNSILVSGDTAGCLQVWDISHYAMDIMQEVYSLSRRNYQKELMEEQDGATEDRESEQWQRFA